MIRYALPFLTLLILFSVRPTIPSACAEDVASWDFAAGETDFTPNAQTKLSVRENHLVVTSTGDDPWFTAKVSAPEGWHRLIVKAKFDGRASFQLFWTTEKDPATKEAHSVRTDFRGNKNQFKTIAIFFRTDSPVTSLRFDPFGSPGEMQIDSIVVNNDAPPPPVATPVADIKLPEGFKVERLHSVQAEEHGSWVCMTTDPKGRLIVSDQYGKLFRVTPPPIGSEEAIQIETIDLDIGMAQGLTYAFDSLYVVMSGPDSERHGLYRLQDTNGDDQFDSVEMLRKLHGGGEHGPHAVIPSPDGKSLYFCAGNHTAPTEFSTSLVPKVWKEDLLLPRMWDAGGHAVGKLAPGGWIAKVSPDGKDWELVANGFRNEYDIAFSPEGELFTYDADMEWDVGTPWYRPTRVNHVTSGAEFGWRSGTGKWPVWYPDSLPSVVDIGQGSPTGIVFGTGTSFPEKYQRALFISDWSYGVIYAVHMKPDGATWTAEAERFAAAAPLPATDLIVGQDGALYFTIGGRRTQSGLYRITYVGDESTAPVTTPVTKNEDLRQIRRQLEELHTPDAENAIEKAWPYLGHEDRHIRYAARIAIEHQPVSEWAQKALNENSNADAKITALLALTRHGDASLQESLLQSLAGVAGQNLNEQQALAAYRVLGLAFTRMGAPGTDLAYAVGTAIGANYPAETNAMNRELCALLVYLEHEDVVEKTLDLMESAPAQEEQMHYALCLRTCKSGWNAELRTRYFNWFLNATKMSGGHSFSGFLKNIRQEAIDALSKEEAAALKDVLAKSPEPAEAVIEAASRPLVKKWKVDDLINDVRTGLSGRNYANGKKMFTVTACYKCHRFAGVGGIVGPDLTGVGRRFNARNLLESIIEPSKVISDQYTATVFLTTEGRQIIGRVVNLGGDRLQINENMLHPGKLTGVRRDEIEEMFTSKTSMMPSGLVDNLTRDEILDLMAYLQSGGDAQASVFSTP